jgi:hypothetical protein
MTKERLSHEETRRTIEEHLKGDSQMKITESGRQRVRTKEFESELRTLADKLAVSGQVENSQLGIIFCFVALALVDTTKPTTEAEQRELAAFIEVEENTSEVAEVAIRILGDRSDLKAANGGAAITEAMKITEAGRKRVESKEFAAGLRALSRRAYQSLLRSLGLFCREGT